jgi:hypothetical protein
MADHFEPMAGDLKALLAEPVAQAGRQFVEELRIVGQGQVMNFAGVEAAHVVMGLAVAIVAGGTFAVGEFVGQTGGNEGVEGLVHRCQADVGQLLANRGVNLVGRRVRVGRAEGGKHCGSLASVTPTGSFQGMAEFCFPGNRECRI